MASEELNIILKLQGMDQAKALLDFFQKGGMSATDFAKAQKELVKTFNDLRTVGAPLAGTLKDIQTQIVANKDASTQLATAVEGASGRMMRSYFTLGERLRAELSSQRLEHRVTGEYVQAFGALGAQSLGPFIGKMQQLDGAISLVGASLKSVGGPMGSFGGVLAAAAIPIAVIGGAFLYAADMAEKAKKHVSELRLEIANLRRDTPGGEEEYGKELIGAEARSATAYYGVKEGPMAFGLRMLGNILPGAAGVGAAAWGKSLWQEQIQEAYQVWQDAARKQRDYAREENKKDEATDKKRDEEKKKRLEERLTLIAHLQYEAFALGPVGPSGEFVSQMAGITPIGEMARRSGTNRIEGALTPGVPSPDQVAALNAELHRMTEKMYTEQIHIGKQIMERGARNIAGVFTQHLGSAFRGIFGEAKSLLADLAATILTTIADSVIGGVVNFFMGGLLGATNIMDSGGVITEPVIGRGLKTGASYRLAWNGAPERVTPMGGSWSPSGSNDNGSIVEAINALNTKFAFRIRGDTLVAALDRGNVLIRQTRI